MNRSLLIAIASLALAACGGGSDQAPAANGADTGSPSPSQSAAGGGPGSEQTKERLLINANMITPDSARIVSYAETGVQLDGPPEMQSAIVSYEAELEFTAETYFVTDRKPGDRAKVFGEAEYINEGGTWRLLTMGIHPL